jgi:UDP-N-acetyl-D-mannosaminuronic acid dehydrogenase/UDP-N-acetyl-D-glucosamine dehydrogenase
MQKRRVAVIGLGYVGLPLAVRAVDVGHDVVGFDVDTGRVELLAAGRSFVDDITDGDVASAIGSGRFTPTTDPAALSGFDIAVITVPTPLRDGAPDLSHVEDAARIIAPNVRPGSCVVLESTTYPGSTEVILVPLLQAGSGLRAGRDFHVGYSPERIDPSNRTWQFRNTPKLVSGIDEASLSVAAEFYAGLVDQVVTVSGTREAELAKLLENTFRHVNIALVNELAVFCDEFGIDVWSVLDAAATKPFGFMRFEPGPGVGGHCLPIDPSYLSWHVRRSLGRTFRFVEIANDVNDHMPDYVVGRATAHLNRDKKPVNGSTILLLGLTYKANSRDARNSPAMMVADRLRKLGANLLAVDPHLDPDEAPEGLALVPCSDEYLSSADLIVVLTAHDGLDWDAVERHASRVLDTRNRLASRLADRL